jgi:hypothetical protein
MNAVVMGLVALAMAGPEPKQDKKVGQVQCEIQVVHATRGKPFIDPALKKLSRYLDRSFGSRYQRFTSLKRHVMLLKKHQSGENDLPNNTVLKLTFKGTENSLLRLEMAVGGLKTTVKIHDGGLFFQAGRRYKGGMIIVAIRIRSVH